MRIIKSTVLFTLLLLAFGCRQDATVSPIDPDRGRVNFVSAGDIPWIMNRLEQDLGQLQEAGRSSNGGATPTAFGELDLEKIMEVIDSLDNAAYTFWLDDGDNSPYTFSNLVVKKQADGMVEAPYINDFKVDPNYEEAFLESGFSMAHFTGGVSKRYLNALETTKLNQANLGGLMDRLDDPSCPATPIDGGRSGGGGETPGDTGNPPGPGGAFGETCTMYTISSEVYYKEVGHWDGKYHPSTTTIPQRLYINVWDCYEWADQSANDGENCPGQESGENGVITQPDECPIGYSPDMYLSDKLDSEQLGEYVKSVACDLDAHWPQETGELGLFLKLFHLLEWENLSWDDHKKVAGLSQDIWSHVSNASFSLGRPGTAADTTMLRQVTEIIMIPVASEGMLAGMADVNWGEFIEIIKPLLVDLALSAVPGYEVVEVMQHVADGDYKAAATAIAFAVGSYIGLKAVKVIFKFYKVVRKGYSVWKHARKHFKTLSNAAKNASMIIDVDGSTIKVFNNAGDEVANIVDDILTFKYSGFGGKITTSQGKTTTVIGKWQDTRTGAGTSEIINSGLSKSGKNPGGINALAEEVPSDWPDQRIWDEVNEPWLKAATERGDVIRVTSNPLDNAQKYNSDGSLTFFGREIEFLEANGYYYDVTTYTFKLR